MIDTHRTSHDDLIAALRARLGAANLLTAPADTAPFTEDWRRRYRGEASCVALPANTGEVSAVLAACHAAGVAVVPQGGNTGLTASGIPVATRIAHGDAPVVLGLRRMNRIRSIDTVGNVLVAEAGCILETVQQAAAAHDRLYPVSFGAQGSCQIGGAVSTNAGGTGVLKYGNTREQVLGLEVVLSDGRVWDGLRPLRKDNTGYALKHLFIGGEGTLGVITAVSLRMQPRPAARAAAWLAVASAGDALRVFTGLQSIAGDRISACEILNATELRTIATHLDSVRVPLNTDTPYAVLVELSDTWARADLQGLMEDALAALAEQGAITDAAIAVSEAQREAFWAVRHGVAEANRRAGIGVSCDVAVPVAAVAEFIERASAAVHVYDAAMQIPLAGHLGDGNIHFAPRFSFEAWRALGEAGRQEAASAEVRRRVHDVAIALQGTFSAEHGVGYALVEEMRRLRAPLELQLMRAVRDAIDPAGIMNPGKVLSRR